VDGGASANDLLMQLQADLLGIPVVRPKNLQTTAFGAAFLAGLGAGVWQNPEQIRRVWKADRRFAPKMKAAQRDLQLAKWERAVSRA
jgi:glycerol kinase